MRHRVPEKEDEKTEKYQELKREIMGITHLDVILIVVGALGVVSKRIDAWLARQGITIKSGTFAENSLARNSKDPKDCVRNLKERLMIQRTFGHWL